MELLLYVTVRESFNVTWITYERTASDCSSVFMEVLKLVGKLHPAENKLEQAMREGRPYAMLCSQTAMLPNFGSGNSFLENDESALVVMIR